MHHHPRIAALLQSLNNPSLPGIDLSLDRMRQLLAAFDHPERNLPPVIHLAGTNGKGSTQAFLRAIYEAAGYRVHAYTSPHLVRFNERITIAGAEISDDYLEQLLARVAVFAREILVTFFEATTAAAFLAFSEHQADVVLLETGMGGRLDATNLIDQPLATIITPIDYDHMEFLGKTLGQIAGEKAGIMKRGVPCFVGEQVPEAREVIKRAARERRAEIHLYGREWSYDRTGSGFTLFCGPKSYALPTPSLTGDHQYHNAALATTVALTLQALPVTAEALAKGIAGARWSARLQSLHSGPIVGAWGARGAVYLDGGHNLHAARMLATWAKQQEHPITLMLGMMQRKDARAFLEVLAPYVRQLFAVPIAGEDCHVPESLAAIGEQLGVAKINALSSLDNFEAVLTAEAKGTLLIAGSLFLAGQVLEKHS